eukprot:TRINITY_DN59254_c0_g1_i1.p1 TRINITY_DN59254_c0_g1~~TRINITY_DN59254_c0_g1_i1.p1  ORF type:complete len:463 (-),score=84.47 TRINITY_DN59254_c0_g1_i1:137-1489(-)
MSPPMFWRSGQLPLPVVRQLRGLAKCLLLAPLLLADVASSFRRTEQQAVDRGAQLARKFLPSADEHIHECGICMGVYSVNVKELKHLDVLYKDNPALFGMLHEKGLVAEFENMQLRLLRTKGNRTFRRKKIELYHSKKSTITGSSHTIWFVDRSLEKMFIPEDLYVDAGTYITALNTVVRLPVHIVADQLRTTTNVDNSERLTFKKEKPSASLAKLLQKHDATEEYAKLRAFVEYILRARSMGAERSATVTLAGVIESFRTQFENKKLRIYANVHTALASRFAKKKPADPKNKFALHAVKRLCTARWIEIAPIKPTKRKKKKEEAHRAVVRRTVCEEAQRHYSDDWTVHGQSLEALLTVHQAFDLYETMKAQLRRLAKKDIPYTCDNVIRPLVIKGFFGKFGARGVGLYVGKTREGLAELCYVDRTQWSGEPTKREMTPCLEAESDSDLD